MFAVLAKAEGSKIFSDLPVEERKFAIEKEMSKIEGEIEAELGRKHLMQLEFQCNPDSISLENNIKKCAGNGQVAFFVGDKAKYRASYISTDSSNDLHLCNARYRTRSENQISMPHFTACFTCCQIIFLHYRYPRLFFSKFSFARSSLKFNSRKSSPSNSKVSSFPFYTLHIPVQLVVFLLLFF